MKFLGLTVTKNKPLINDNQKVNKGFPMGFNVYFTGTQSPVWINTQNLQDYARIVSENPVAYSVIDILSRHMANGKVMLKDLSTGELISKENILESKYKNNKIVQKAFKLFEKPNPLQSRWDFLRTYLFFKKTFGNAFLYGLKPDLYPFNIENVTNLWNIWPQYMNVVLAGNYFAATNISEIIKEWRFGYLAGKGLTFTPDCILHRKEINVELKNPEDLIFGKPILNTLTWPLSNIEMGYESENVVLKNRGARIIVSPSDQSGNEFKNAEPWTSDEKLQLEEDFADYGMLQHQKPALITRWPAKFTVLDQDIRKLGIFESIANNALVVAHAFGVPEILVKLYIQGATFENQQASVRRMYEDTIIPEFEDFIDDLNDWLKLVDFGYQFVATFDHVPVLQENFKEKAIANRQKSAYYKELFEKGGCTLNEWRKSIGLHQSPEYELKIFDLSDDEKRALGINVPTDPSNTGNQTQNAN